MSTVAATTPEVQPADAAAVEVHADAEAKPVKARAPRAKKTDDGAAPAERQEKRRERKEITVDEADLTAPIVLPPRVERPDMDAHRAKITELSALIARKREDLKANPAATTPEEIKVNELNAVKKALDEEISGLTRLIDAAAERKKTLAPAAKDAKQRERENLEVIQSRRQGGRAFKSVAEIDFEIRRLEAQFAIGSGGKNQEKALSRSISELNALRASFASFELDEKRQEELRASTRSVQDELAAVAEELGKLLPQKKALLAKRDELRTELDKAYGEMKAVRKSTISPAIAEIEAIQAEITALKDAVAKQWDGFKAFQEADIKRMKIERILRERERAARIAAAIAAREAREAAAAKRKAEFEEEKKARAEAAKAAARVTRLDPKKAEIEKCVSLTAYLTTKKGLHGATPKVEQRGKPLGKAAELTARKKGEPESEDEMFGRGTRVAKVKAPRGAAAGSSTQVLRHPPEVVEAFQAAGVAAPESFADIDAAITALAAKKVEYEGMRRTAEELDAEDAIEEAKAAEAAKAAADAKAAAKAAKAAERAAKVAAGEEVGPETESDDEEKADADAERKDDRPRGPRGGAGAAGGRGGRGGDRDRDGAKKPFEKKDTDAKKEKDTAAKKAVPKKEKEIPAPAADAAAAADLPPGVTPLAH